MRRIFGADVDLAVASGFDISLALQRAFRERQSHRAVFGLAEADPLMSAQRVATLPQMVILYALATVLLAGLALAPIATLIALNVVMTIFYTGNFAFKTLLVWVGGAAQDRSSRAIAAEVIATAKPLVTS